MAQIEDERRTGESTLYFVAVTPERYIECQVEYDDDTKEWVLYGNDSEIARF